MCLSSEPDVRDFEKGAVSHQSDVDTETAHNTITVSLSKDFIDNDQNGKLTLQGIIVSDASGEVSKRYSIIRAPKKAYGLEPVSTVTGD